MRTPLFAALVLVAACSGGAPASPSPAAPSATPVVTSAPTPSAAPTVAPTASAVATPGSTAGYSCDPDMGYGCDSTPAPTGSVGGATVSVSTAGNYLVGPSGMALYTFDPDSTNHSACTSSDCVSAWPPLTVDGGATPTAGGGANGALTTFDRGGGVMQVAYNGKPLYYFVGDSAPTDTSGDGINGVWHLATP